MEVEDQPRKASCWILDGENDTFAVHLYLLALARFYVFCRRVGIVAKLSDLHYEAKSEEANER